MNETPRSLFVHFLCGVLLPLLLGWLISDWVIGGEPLTTSNSSAEIDARQLVTMLGDDSFQIREAASERLVQMGMEVTPYLDEGKKANDREVRYRCERILHAIVLRDRQECIDSLLAGDETRLGELPGWPRFRSAFGDSGVTRELFVEMLRDEWDLLDATQNEKSIAREVSRRVVEINETRRLYRRTIPLGSILTVMFLASEDMGNVNEATGQQVFSMLYQASFRSAITQHDRKDVLRSMLGRWIAQESGQTTLHYALNFALEHNLKEGLIPAKRAIEDRKLPAHIRQYGVLVVAKLGSKEHYEYLRGIFDDETVCSRQQVNKTELYQTQVRDLALAARIHLAGEDPRDFGFERSQTNPRNVFNPTSLGFPSDEARTAAFEKWAEWFKQNASASASS